MAERKFRFVSPGIFINEVDNSQIPNVLPDVGPVIIGRSEFGPAMVPIRVNSPSEFVEFFGNPIPGGKGGDVWREGNYASPTYGAYAAMAYLKAGVGPVTFIRLLGEQHPSATTGLAGWDTVDNTVPSSTLATHGGAFGLFLFASSSQNMYNADIGTGKLAAIWYTNSASVGLSGDDVAGAAVTNKALGFVKATAAGPEFKAVVTSPAGAYTTSFNFDRNSSKYIRKVFNTNPQLLGAGTAANRHSAAPSSTSDQSPKYWLGETFERFISDASLLTGDANVYGIIVPLHDGQATDTTARNLAQHKVAKLDPQTGWVVSQNTSTVYSGYTLTNNCQKLFKLIARNHASWASSNLKISVIDIKAPTNDIDKYGTFTVQVRRADDTDNVPQVVEQYTGCNLNPASENYIAKKIGDKYMLWNDSEKRLKEYGEYDNQSKYIYVEMDDNVANAVTDPVLLPFGFYGPKSPNSFRIFSGSTSTYLTSATTTAGTRNRTFATGSSTYVPNAYTGLGTTSFAYANGANFTASFAYPSIALRVSASDGGISNPKNSYFGVQTTIAANSKRYDPGYVDLVKPLPGTAIFDAVAANDNVDYSFQFTLEDVSGSTGVWISGAAAAGTSLNAVGGTYTSVLDSGFNRFTMPLWGGHDGVNIVEQDPFNNGAIGSSTTELTSYALYTVKKAVDTVADPEFVECNLISVPGVTQPVITDQVIAVCESRADAIGVIDIEGVYTPSEESTSSFKDRLGTPAQAVSTFKNRRVNSSYACTYYPWVRIRDDISNASVWVPPSVIAIGTFASSEAKAELWFAPAGFTRGGLSNGAGGWPVLSTTERLRREDRDLLYEANINPIATFPSEGIVIFGQKTLQVTPSALDRINVRRLMIFLKKRISRIASSILFDQNVRTTWNRFKSEADKFLGSVQARLGLTEFRVILDETTTTPDLVDRNILYAKIFLKPARAIEFIAIDFVITRTGASFDD